MNHIHWSVDPILVSFGGLSVHWYGVLFASAILSGFAVMNWIYKQESKPIEQLESLQIYIVIGIVVGARLGHCLFYDPAYYLSHPWKILAVNEGGLASHGGGLGAMLAAWYYAKKNSIAFIYLLDRLAIPTALFAFFVRMGNLMNSEIVGTHTDVAWAFVFTRVDELPRHPAQLYEALSYLAIFFILVTIYKLYASKVRNGLLFGTFLTLVFAVRILVEFVKVRQAAYADEMLFSTGQYLSLPFLLMGVGLVFYSYRSLR